MTERVAKVQPSNGKPAGFISWEEHCEAHVAYAAKYRNDQSAERIAERGGFSYGELILFLGREPTTWRAVNLPDGVKP